MTSAISPASESTHTQAPQTHYERRRPEETMLYRIVQENLETFLAQIDMETGQSLPEFVTKEFDDYLQCEILAHGFLRAKCENCKHKKLIAFSCKCRGFCPNCGARRMSSTAVHLVEEVIPEVPVRQLTPGMACNRAMQEQLAEGVVIAHSVALLAGIAS